MVQHFLPSVAVFAAVQPRQLFPIVSSWEIQIVAETAQPVVFQEPTLIVLSPAILVVVRVVEFLIVA